MPGDDPIIQLYTANKDLTRVWEVHMGQQCLSDLTRLIRAGHNVQLLLRWNPDVGGVGSGNWECQSAVRNFGRGFGLHEHFPHSDSLPSKTVVYEIQNGRSVHQAPATQ